MMRLNVKSGDLAKELGLSQKIVGRKSTIPALGYVLIEPADGGIMLTATDTEVALRTFCPCVTVPSPGSALLPARRLHEIMRLIAADAVVDISRKDDRAAVQIESDSYETKLQALSTEDFPKVSPMPTGDGVVLPSRDLALMAAQVSFAFNAADQRYFLGGAQLSLDPGVMTLAATDGHRLAISSAPRPGTTVEPTQLIPGKTLQELRPLLEDEAIDVVLRVAENHIWFEAGQRQLMSRMIDGKFPNTARIVPTRNDKRVVVNRDRLSLAIRRASSVSSGDVRSVKLAARPGEIHVSATGVDVGEAVDRISVGYDGPETTVSLSSQYLLDFLEVALAGDVAIEIFDDASAVIMRQMSGEPATYVCVIMPLRA